MTIELTRHSCEVKGCNQEGHKYGKDILHLCDYHRDYLAKGNAARST